MAESKALLTGEFFVKISSGAKAVKHKVVLTQKELTFECLPGDRSRNSPFVINLFDVIGCNSEKSSKEESGHSSEHLKIYSYPHHKKFGSKKTVRQRNVSEIHFASRENPEHNNAATWRSVITKLIHGQQPAESIITLAQLLELPEPKRRRCLVLVNPFGGAGKAVEIFQDKVAPMMAEANVAFNLVITERAGHAQELVTTIDVSEWDAIVIVSGDGLLYEVVQGLMSRADWQTAIKTPLGIIPGGSGNALSCSMLYYAGEPYLDNAVLHAAFLLLKFNVRPMDLVAIDTASGKRLYSFLSVGWAIISDVDIESEKYRSLGGARFTVGALVRIVGLRTYRGRLSFLPVDKYEAPAKKKMPRSKSVGSEPNEPRQVYSRSVSTQDTRDVDETGEDVFVNPSPSHTNGGGQGRGRESGESSRHVSAAGATTARCEPAIPLPPLTEPLPAGWVTLDDNFVLVAVQYLSHLGADMMAAPESRLDDGIMYIAFASAGISRARLIAMFLAMETGSHKPGHGLEIVKVKAFRLEPLTEKGRMTVDGEVVDYGPIQGSVVPSAARVVCLPNATRM